MLFLFGFIINFYVVSANNTLKTCQSEVNLIFILYFEPKDFFILNQTPYNNLMRVQIN